MITVLYLENVRKKACRGYGRLVDVADVHFNNVPKWTYARNSVVHGVWECVVHLGAVFVLSRSEANSVRLHCSIVGYTYISRQSRGRGGGRRRRRRGRRRSRRREWSHRGAIKLIECAYSGGREGACQDLQRCLGTCTSDVTWCDVRLEARAVSDLMPYNAWRVCQYTHKSVRL